MAKYISKYQYNLGQYIVYTFVQINILMYIFRDSIVLYRHMVKVH